MWRLAWRIFRGLGAAQHWSRRRFTPAGLFVIGAATLAAAFGADTNQSLAYKVFTTLVALLAVAWVAGRFQRGRFEVRREVPRAVAAGESFDYRVRVRNLGDERVEGARLLEDLDDPRPSFAVFRTEARRPTYAEWWRVMERRRVAWLGEPLVPPLAAHGEAEFRVTVRTYRRGRLRLGSCTVSLTEPLGLVRRGARVAVEDHVLVVPRRYKLPPLSLPGARRFQMGGVTQSTSVGDSEECIGLRDYRPGDPFQRIHWKSFARRGQPVVREFQDEYFERHALVLDTFCGPGGEDAFEEAVAVAASLAETIDTRECLLDLMFVGAHAYTFTAGRGQMQPDGLLAVLAGVEPCRDRLFRVLHNEVLARRAAMSGALVILLAWDDARRDFVDEMRSLGLSMRILLVSATPAGDVPAWVKVLHPERIQEGLASL
jgi:uncharacterized protein (DUF58 family)